ncbi:MAG: sigma-54-dependent Fis family transcriptional regulator [Spirochaetes bacterium GWB1_59_5]|nr:MAG: sigma-54-dependent Fis family transcriptional regulator [Spirochaetes bacterium GWB1_59_5]
MTLAAAKLKSIDSKNEADELSFLLDLSRILDRSADLRSFLSPLLEMLDTRAGLSRGIVTLIDHSVGMLKIEDARGLTEDEKRQGVYRLGEGLVGRVFESCNPIKVPDLFKEPRFLNHPGSRGLEELKRTAFYCVPIRSGIAMIGTLSAERRRVGDNAVGEHANLERVMASDMAFLERVAALIAESSRMRDRLQRTPAKLETTPLGGSDCSDGTGVGISVGSNRQEDLPPSLSGGLVGTSAAMRAVYELVAQVAPSDATVLVTGESGTGKELVAVEIHRLSKRCQGPLIKVNCSALPESVIESELFGHERGAFSGAIGQRKGRFELAHGGTLFLDEIGELSAQVQVKLLRVLQEREIERVGGTATVKVDVRVIAATNRRLEDEIAGGRFREDLYYRLNVFPIRVPPLRERKSDIVLLADHFAEKYSLKNGKLIKRISSPALDLFTSYHWPGNVRELENCIERATILSTDTVIHSYHLPPSLQSAQSTHTEPTTTLDAALSRLEKELIVEALKISGGNMASASRRLGISERQMGLRVHHYGINWKLYRTTLV